MARKDRTVKDVKVSPEHHERLKRIGAKKGEPSRNPSGRPPMPEELKTTAAFMSPEALLRIEYMAEHSTNEMVRFRCNELILSYNMSKAAQKTEVDVNVVHQSGLLARAARAREIVEGTIIEATLLPSPAASEQTH